MEANATLGDGCEIREHLHSFWEKNLSRVVLSLYEWLYKILRLTNTRAENSKNVVLVPAGYQSSAPQFDSRELFAFSSCLRNLCWEAAGHKISDLVEDSDTHGPSSLSVRMEYLFALQL